MAGYSAALVDASTYDDNYDTLLDVPKKTGDLRLRSNFTKVEKIRFMKWL